MNIKELLHKVLSIVLPLGMAMGSLCLASCEETPEVDEYANWQERNTEYIDSIATVAKANADGKWLRILSFKLNDTDINGNPVEYGNENYVYCYVENEGDGMTSPLYTDMVSVNYRGRLIPSLAYPEGKIFDESYKGAFDAEMNSPRIFNTDDLIVGWGTALMRMTIGDRWRVYIPAELGYGSRQQGDIPPYSALVFDMNLVDIVSIDED